MTLRFKKWIGLLGKAYDNCRRDDVGGLAAELAYRFFLALFPAVILVASASGVIASVFSVVNPTDRIIEALGDTLPSDLTSVLRGQLESIVDSPNPILLAISVLGALWTASGGVVAAMKAVNRAYGVIETRPWYRRYVLAIGLTISAGATVILASILALGGQVFGDDIASAIGIEGAFVTLLMVLRWPVTVLLLIVAISFLYWACPAVKFSFKWITPGAVVATLAWLALTYLFGLYVSNMGSYNATYGTLGAAVAVLVWLYFSAYALLLGAELNAFLQEQINPAQFAHHRRAAAFTRPADEPQRYETARQGSPGTQV